MSTQSTPSVLFTHQYPQQGFRLLELPPELADLLSSDNPPTLELKSPAPSTAKGNGSNEPGSEYVNLCSPSQTYSIRQVQSSNSLHILRPSNGLGVRKDDLRIVDAGIEEKEKDDGEDVDMDTDSDRDLNIEGTVTSIAKCGSTLELHAQAGGFSAAPFLTSLVKVYDQAVWEDGVGNEDRDEKESVVGSSEVIKMRRGILDRLLADVPVSRAQCEHDWVDMCAFIILQHTTSWENGLGSASLCWRPSAEMKLEVWKRAVEGAVLQGIDLGKQFLVEDLWKSILDDDGLAPFPRPLFEAIIRRIQELADGVERGFAESEMKWASIDKETCVQWVGEICLETMAIGPTSAIDESEFVNAWKDKLPESWREDASKSILPENCYMHPEPKTICFATETDRQKAKKNLPTDINAATVAKKTRNWHELFKNQKRQKR